MGFIEFRNRAYRKMQRGCHGVAKRLHSSGRTTAPRAPVGAVRAPVGRATMTREEQ
jgi:hypothetical protein